MADGITIRILGDYGPFSRMGKSIGYQITIGQSSYLLDCGAPLFQQIGGHALKGVKGLIITHCHDDHKRWFTDLALFNKYAPDFLSRVHLITSEDVHDELLMSSGPALDRSLSGDSKNVIDISCEDYIDYRILGPRARYRIVKTDEGNGKTGLYVSDREGNMVGPERAKIVISRKTRRPRMLFKDPDYGEWIEPESFYPFSSSVFYEDDRNIYAGAEGFTIEAIKAPVWHGITGIGIVVRTDEEIAVFSSDTAHDTGLWKTLCTEKRARRSDMSEKEFASATVLYGDINDYIERAWSEERYRDALGAFREGIVVHNISVGNSVVHTNYEALKKTCLEKKRVILTHSPDMITSEWVLSRAEKTFRIKGDRFYEVVGDRLFPMNADIYHKESGRYFVGYRNELGRYAVHENNGRLGLFHGERPDTARGRLLYHVDIYEDISGKYFPRTEDPDSLYLERKDGKVELIRFTEKGSTGIVAEDHRHRLQEKRS